MSTNILPSSSCSDDLAIQRKDVSDGPVAPNQQKGKYPQDRDNALLSRRDVSASSSSSGSIVHNTNRSSIANENKNVDADSVEIKKEMSAEDALLERQRIAVSEGRCIDLITPAKARDGGENQVEVISEDGEIIEQKQGGVVKSELSFHTSITSPIVIDDDDDDESENDDDEVQCIGTIHKRYNLRTRKLQDRASCTDEAKYSCLACKELFHLWSECFQHMRVCCPEERVDKWNQRILTEKCLTEQAEKDREEGDVRSESEKNTTTEKSHRCPDCGDIVTAPCLCNGHLKSIEYKCPECEHTFSKWEYCEIHMRKFCPSQSNKQAEECRVVNSKSHSGFKCPKCDLISPKWHLCLKHMKTCCPSAKTKGMMHQYAVKGKEQLKKSSAAKKTENKSSLDGPVASSQSLNNNARETSQRKVSNLPAWMTNGQNRDKKSSTDNKSANLLGSANMKETCPSSSSSFNQARESLEDSTSIRKPSRPVAETSKRAGISNLPAWMTNGSTSRIEPHSTGGNASLIADPTGALSPDRQGTKADSRKSKTSKTLVSKDDYSCSSSSVSFEQRRTSETRRACARGSSRLVTETSRRAGISNLPAWMTTNNDKYSSMSSDSKNDKGSLAIRASIPVAGAPSVDSEAMRIGNLTSNSSKSLMAREDRASSSSTFDQRRACETSRTSASGSSRPATETSQRAGVSNLPAWMTNGAGGKTLSQSTNGKSYSTTEERRRNDRLKSSMHSRSIRRNSAFDCHDKSLTTKKSAFRQCDTGRASRAPSENSDNACNRSYDKNSINRVPKETSARRGISNLPAWMTKSNSRPSKRIVDINQSSCANSRPISKKQRLDPDVLTTTFNSRNDTYRSSNITLTHQKSNRWNDDHSSASTARETSKRRGISNLPAWMTCKD